MAMTEARTGMSGDGPWVVFSADSSTELDDSAIQTHTGLRYSWRDLDRASAMIANLFADWAVPMQARVLVQVEPSVEAVVLYLACCRAGHEWVTLEHHRPIDELAGVLAAVQPAVLVCSSARMGGLSKLAFQAGTRHVVTLNTDRTGSLLDRAGHHADAQAPVQGPVQNALQWLPAALSARPRLGSSNA